MGINATLTCFISYHIWQQRRIGRQWQRVYSRSGGRCSDRSFRDATIWADEGVVSYRDPILFIVNRRLNISPPISTLWLHKRFLISLFCCLSSALLSMLLGSATGMSVAIYHTAEAVPAL